MVTFKPILYINGYLLLVLAVAMGVPALVDVLMEDLDWQVFAASAAVTAFCALALMLGSRPDEAINLSTRQAFLLTGSSWLVLVLFGSLPFAFSFLDMSFTDSFFESMSGLTASGSTVIVGLDHLPHGLLLWRAILHWLGGIGIIVMAVALLPLLRIGGMQLFRMESSEKTEKATPRISQMALAIFIVYSVFTATCALALWLAGMQAFDAICHAMSTLATGGFSTSDRSVGAFDNHLIEWIIIVFMMIGGATFVLYIMPWTQAQRWALLGDIQVRWYLGVLAFFALTVGLWRWASSDVAFYEAMRHSLFSVVAVVTTTGFAVADYSAWGGFAQVTFFVLAFLGGCTGSTSGGIKIFRWQVLFAMAGTHIKRLLHPHGMFVINFNRQSITEPVVRSVVTFVVLYFFIFAMLTMALSLVGLDMLTALSSAVAALGNVGPGLGHIVGPAGTFEPLPDAAKWLLAFGMLLGRLEILTVIVLFSPFYWRG